DGLEATYFAPLDPKLPVTSTGTSTGALATRHTFPPSSSATTTLVATVVPARASTIETSAGAAPHGKAPTDPSPTGPTAVRLNDTAVAEPGTPSMPATVNFTGTSGWTCPWRAESVAPARVSTKRVGVIGV